MSEPRVPKEVLDEPEAVLAFTRSIAFMMAAGAGRGSTTASR